MPPAREMWRRTGRHSPYTGALVEHLRTPGTRILDVFTAVSQSVYAATGGQQEPWVANSLRENFVLGGGTAPVAPPESPGLRENVQSADPAQAACAAAREIGTAAAYEAVIAAIVCVGHTSSFGIQFDSYTDLLDHASDYFYLISDGGGSVW